MVMDLGFSPRKERYLYEMWAFDLTERELFDLRVKARLQDFAFSLRDLTDATRSTTDSARVFGETMRAIAENEDRNISEALESWYGSS